MWFVFGYKLVINGNDIEYKNIGIIARAETDLEALSLAQKLLVQGGLTNVSFMQEHNPCYDYTLEQFVKRVKNRIEDEEF